MGQKMLTILGVARLTYASSGYRLRSCAAYMAAFYAMWKMWTRINIHASTRRDRLRFVNRVCICTLIDLISSLFHVEKRSLFGCLSRAGWALPTVPVATPHPPPPPTPHCLFGALNVGPAAGGRDGLCSVWLVPPGLEPGGDVINQPKLG